jgi:hypothetical protein
MRAVTGPKAARLVAVALGCAFAACTGSAPDVDAGASDAGPVVLVEGACGISGEVPAFVTSLPCTADFRALSSLPTGGTLPGATSVKVVYDRHDGALYFQDSVAYPIHYAFVSAHLSGGERPIVPTLSSFNSTEYFSPDRRFILGAVTFYEGPAAWTLELSPYDTASAALIETLYRAVAAATFFGPALLFHATSENVQVEADKLPDDVRTVDTDTLYQGINFQPLSLGVGVGRLRFVQARTLQSDTLSVEDLVVLDEVPNDISVVQGIITAAFQTPLSHVNVLSLNRRTPNMGLRGAMENPTLRGLEGQLVELTVSADAYSVRAVDAAYAAAFWEENRPTPVVLPPLDLSQSALLDVDDIVAEPTGDETLRDVIAAAVPAYGGKAAHYSVLRRLAGVPIRDAFVVPVVHYDTFMRDNGFSARVQALLADPGFATDASVRTAALQQLRDDMVAAPVSTAFQDQLSAAIAARYTGQKLRFRTSTNSEDLEGFPCAGCYESHTGDPADWDDVLTAIKETWASLWLARTFEERSYYGVAHDAVGMALLVHPNFPDEEANGVAVTNNIFDPSGLEPAFYVNVQAGGDAEVVAPPPGVTSDELLYFFSLPNQPVTFLSRSNLVPAGQTVLTPLQLRDLGLALDAIHRGFSAAYGPQSGNNGFYAMDVEFKLDDEDDPAGGPQILIKQARPYPTPATP